MKAGIFFMSTLFQSTGAAVDKVSRCKLHRHSTPQTSTTRISKPEKMSDVPPLYPFPAGPDPFPADRPIPRHGNISKNTRCLPCLEKLGIEKYHRHFSSAYFTKKSVLLGEELKCPTCKTLHNPTLDNRLIIIYAASTIHNVVLNNSVRFSFHVNIETICGAKLVDLFNDWTATYANLTIPMDVIVIATANDSPNTSPTEYENLLTKWTFKVWDCNKSNTFRICKMLRPPAKVWFPRNGALPSNYTNHIDHINQLNKIIDIQNMMNVDSQVIGFNNEGCRTSRKRTRDNDEKKGELSHIFSAWREYPSGKHCGYHLNDHNQVLMMKRLYKFIEHKIKNIPTE